MTTLTQSDTIITVCVLFGLCPLFWGLFFAIYSGKKSPRVDRGENSIFLSSVYAKVAYILSLICFLAASILLIVFSIDDGNTANRLN